MHILVIPSWYPNSYSTLNGIFFKEQAEALAQTEHKVGVIALTQVSIQDILKNKQLKFSFSYKVENGVATYLKEYPIIPKLYRKSNLCHKRKKHLFVKLFEQYIEKEGIPDIVHLHSFFHGNLAIWIKEKYNIPYIVTEHSSSFARKLLGKKELALAREVYSKSSKNIAVSQEFVKLLQQATSTRFDYLPNIVNIDFFTQKNKEKKEGFQFINIAALTPNKNHFLLIKVFKKAFASQENIKLLIVGEGSEYTSLKQLIEDENLTSQVTLYGMADRESVRELLSQSDAFVLSSIYETFGVVLIEALSCGIPVVSTKCGGPESIIVNNNIGLLAEQNIESLSKKMQILFNNRDTFNGEYLRKYAVENFSSKAIIDKLIKIYQGII